VIELKSGDVIELEYGTSVKVIKELGSGGQGIVYLVEMHDKKYALKWYDVDKIHNLNAFKKNIASNIKDGSPSDKFLWPMYMTKARQDNSFGYVMDLKPEGYDSFVDILNMYKISTDRATGRAIKTTVQFKSLYALVNSAINIINAFRQLHRAGKSYQDLNDGGFFIDTNTGDVLVCDCDNIAPEGYNFGIGGKPGYMAPEVVRGLAKPDVQTDKYSLGVVLFKLLFRGDPLEGEKVVKSVCLTEEAELLHYGKDAVFIYDPNDQSNRPVRGVHDNVIKLWNLYPQYIRDCFTKLFTEGIKNPNRRPIENEWQRLFVRLRAEILPCQCGRTTYASVFKRLPNGNFSCTKCESEFFALHFDAVNYDIPIYEGCKLYECDTVRLSDDFNKVTGEVIENKIHRGVFGIKNLSDKVWKAKMPNGEFKDINPNGGFPIWNGLEIDFGDVTARILNSSNIN
jgi:serine/threonine protein kinase